MRRGGICRLRRGRRAVSVQRSSVEQASARRRARDVRTGRPADLPNNESTAYPVSSRVVSAAVTHTGYTHARQPFWPSSGARPSQ